MIQAKENWAQGGGDMAPSEFAKLQNILSFGNKAQNIYDEASRKRAEISEETKMKLKNLPEVDLINNYEESSKKRKNYVDSILAEQNAIYKKLQDETNKKVEEQKEKAEKFTKRADQFKRSFSDYDIYRRLGGETESRNVQNRLMMDILERQKSMPTSTQDYPYEGQLTVTEK
jgi:hypothetical protein